MKEAYIDKASHDEKTASVVSEPAVTTYATASNDSARRIASSWTSEDLEEIIQMSENDYKQGALHTNEEISNHLKSIK